VIDIFAQVTPAGTVHARGTMQINDGTSNTVLVAESRGSSASCADTDTGAQAITELTISFRHERSGDRVLATVTPAEPIAATGRYQVTMVVHRFGSYEVWLDAMFAERPDGSPAR
jgi:hypothetical protein